MDVNKKIKLLIRHPYTQKDTWGKNLLYHFSRHHNVETDFIDFPVIKVPQNTNFIPLIIEDILFIIDDHDYCGPTQNIINLLELDSFYKDKPVFILKIQYSSKHKHIYDLVYDKHNIKVLPFTMFANCKFALENFSWTNTDHEFVCVLTGQLWKDRLSWIEFAEANKETIGCKLDLKKGRAEKSTDKENSEYYDLLKKSKWGVIFKGYGEGGKNRREVEFSSLGMPLALNYQPEYPFDFIPDRDYVYLREYNDLFKLKEIDPAPFSVRSSIIYNQYFSPSSGIYNSFRLVYDMATSLI